MTEKNKNLELVAAVGAGLTTLWKSYKQSAARRHQPPVTSMFDILFGSPEIDDVTAAKYLAEDVSEIRDKLRAEKNKKQFNKIIDNSM